MIIPSPNDFVFKTPLYEILYWKNDNDQVIVGGDFEGVDGKEKAIQDIVCFTGKMDGFCVHCGKESTFKRIGKVPNTWDMGHVMAVHRTMGFTLTCGREDEHKIEIFYNVFPDDLAIVKIGQFPSLASLMKGDVNKYRKILGKQFSEYSRAIGLVSHGVGIGSFVYLRRIFENLVEEAHQLATKDGDWNEDIYIQSRMTEKIKLLKNHLPKFLVENSKIYGILSKGIHELSEQETLEIFPAVKLGIELILDDKLKIQEKIKKEKEGSELIAKIAKDIEQK